MDDLHGLPILFFESGKEWEEWLSDHYDQQTGIWMKFAKKASGVTSITYDAALEVALCYGWIDGQSKSIDEVYYLQKFTPRRPQSMWSKRNIERVTALIKSGRVQAPGLAAIEAAKKDGRWQRAYDAPSSMQMPTDFQEALNKHPKAKAFWQTLNKTNIYAILWRIQTAKRPETRAIRIQKLMKMLEEGKKLH